MEAEMNIREQLLNRIRSINRKYFNPFSMSFAGRPGDYWSVVLHQGRRSGKQYTTPIIAGLQNGSAIIPLPYSQKTDWALNVLAAGSCILIHKGTVYAANLPEIIPITEGGQAFPGIVRNLLVRWDTHSCLRLKELSEAQDGESIYKAFVEAHPRERGIWILVTMFFLLIGTLVLLRRRK